MVLIDVFNPSVESQTVIAYVKEQIKDSIKKQETLNFNYNNYCDGRPKKAKENPEAYQRLMSFEKQKIELLLSLANDLYGRRIIDKHICRRLKIKNICDQCGETVLPMTFQRQLDQVMEKIK